MIVMLRDMASAADLISSLGASNHETYCFLYIVSCDSLTPVVFQHLSQPY